MYLGGIGQRVIAELVAESGVIYVVANLSNKLTWTSVIDACMLCDTLDSMLVCYGHCEYIVFYM